MTAILLDLIQSIAPITPETLGQDVYDRFQAEPDTLATPELPGYVAAAVEDLRRREGAPGPGPGTEPSDDADAPGAPGA